MQLAATDVFVALFPPFLIAVLLMAHNKRQYRQEVVRKRALLAAVAITNHDEYRLREALYGSSAVSGMPGGAGDAPARGPPLTSSDDLFRQYLAMSRASPIPRRSLTVAPPPDTLSVAQRVTTALVPSSWSCVNRSAPITPTEIATADLLLGMSLLHSAVVVGHLPSFNELLHAGAGVEKSAPWRWRQTSLRRHVQVLRVPSVLHVAIYHDRQAMVDALLERGAWVDSNDCPHEYSPLHLAARWHDAVGLSKLLQAGASPAVRNDLGITPLHLACKFGNTKAVSVLLQYGADPHAVDDLGRGLLTFTVYGRQWISSGLNLSSGRPDMQCVNFGSELTTEAPLESYAQVIRILALAGILESPSPTYSQRVFSYLARKLAEEGNRSRTHAAFRRVSGFWQAPTPPSAALKELPLLHAVRCGHLPIVAALVEVMPVDGYSGHDDNHDGVGQVGASDVGYRPATVLTPLGVIASEVCMYECHMVPSTPPTAPEPAVPILGLPPDIPVHAGAGVGAGAGELVPPRWESPRHALARQQQQHQHARIEIANMDLDADDENEGPHQRGILVMILREIRRKLPAYQAIALLLVQAGHDPRGFDQCLDSSPLERLVASAGHSARAARVARKWSQAHALYRRGAAVTHWAFLSPVSSMQWAMPPSPPSLRKTDAPSVPAGNSVQ